MARVNAAGFRDAWSRVVGWDAAVDAKRETIRLQTASINSGCAELARLGPIVVGRHLSHQRNRSNQTTAKVISI